MFLLYTTPLINYKTFPFTFFHELSYPTFQQPFLKRPDRTYRAQSRQSAKPFLQSSELGLSPPSLASECAPPPGSGGRGTFAGERGFGRVPIPTKGHTLWYSLYIRTLCYRVKIHLPSNRYMSVYNPMDHKIAVLKSSSNIKHRRS
jgi:hypothetical protein